MNKLNGIIILLTIFLFSCSNQEPERVKDENEKDSMYGNEFSVNIDFTKTVSIVPKSKNKTEKTDDNVLKKIGEDIVVAFMVEEVNKDDFTPIYGKLFDGTENGKYIPKEIVLKHGHKYRIRATAMNKKETIEYEDGNESVSYGGCFSSMDQKENKIVKSRINGKDNTVFIDLEAPQSSTPKDENTLSYISKGERWYYYANYNPSNKGGKSFYTADIEQNELKVILSKVSFGVEAEISNMVDNYDFYLNDILYGTDTKSNFEKKFNNTETKFELTDKEKSIYSVTVCPKDIEAIYGDKVKGEYGNFRLQFAIKKGADEDFKYFESVESSEFKPGDTFCIKFDAAIDIDSGLNFLIEDWKSSTEIKMKENINN